MPFDPNVHARRRERVFAEMERRGGGAMVLPAADEKLRNAENEYVFRQDSDYLWTVGLDEPTGAAVLVARGGERKLVLFVRPRDKEKEIWNGKRAGVEGAKERFGANEAYPVAELEAKLPDLVEGAPTLWWRFGQDPAWDARMARTLGTLRAGVRTGKRAPLAITRSRRRSSTRSGGAAGAGRATVRSSRPVRTRRSCITARATRRSRTGRCASSTRAASTTGTPPT